MPEAQLDRFLFKIDVQYPNAEEELEIITREQQLENIGVSLSIEPIFLNCFQLMIADSGNLS